MTNYATTYLLCVKNAGNYYFIQCDLLSDIQVKVCIVLYFLAIVGEWTATISDIRVSKIIN